MRSIVIGTKAAVNFISFNQRLIVLLQLFFQALDFLAVTSDVVPQVVIMSFKPFTLMLGGNEVSFGVHLWRVKVFFGCNCERVIIVDTFYCPSLKPLN